MNEQEAEKKQIAWRRKDKFTVWLLIWPVSFLLCYAFFGYVYLSLGLSQRVPQIPSILSLLFAFSGAWLSGRSYRHTMENAKGDARRRSIIASVWFLVRPVVALLLSVILGLSLGYGESFDEFELSGDRAALNELALKYVLIVIPTYFGAWCCGYLFFKVMDKPKKD